MTNANYTRFISAFGKLCYGYDQAAAKLQVAIASYNQVAADLKAVR